MRFALNDFDIRTPFNGIKVTGLLDLTRPVIKSIFLGFSILLVTLATMLLVAIWKSRD